VSTATLPSPGYLPVATETLSPATVVNCDLYIQRQGASRPELYCGRNHSLSPADIDRLRSDGVEFVYIHLEDADSYRQYLCEHVLNQKELSVTSRVKTLRNVAQASFQHALGGKDCDQVVQLSKGLGRDMVTLLTEQPIVFNDLFATLEHDYYTFTHVCNVSVYCVMLASLLGTTDQVQLAELATAGLLHDLGKRHVPSKILNKPGKPTDAEWELIREHPVSGFRELSTRGDLTWAQLMVIYQHHERLDGSGYPAGVMDSDIHPWGKICAIVDVFDALTCQRPYRQAMPLKEVSDYLEKNAGQWFDREFVACWLSHVKTMT
jgi:HD-GYP domain-containing protein (c-di-GMP phosphodiesterase class II)